MFGLIEYRINRGGSINRLQPFQRLIQTIRQELSTELKIWTSAMMVLHQASMIYVRDLMKDALVCAKHSGGVVIKSGVVKMSHRICGGSY